LAHSVKCLAGSVAVPAANVTHTEDGTAAVAAESGRGDPFIGERDRRVSEHSDPIGTVRARITTQAAGA
jgi:hypothetical protein